jgi:hypothetical protein
MIVSVEFSLQSKRKGIVYVKDESIAATSKAEADKKG